MILGVSHIVLGSTDLERDGQFFKTCGWRCRFVERDIRTFQGKRRFMGTSSENLSLSFYLPERGLPVELIQYSDELPSRDPAPLQIVLSAGGSIPGVVEQTAKTVFPGVFEFHIEGFTSPLWWSREALTPSLIVHHVTDIETACRFWESGLGFCGSETQSPVVGGRMLEFPSVMPQWRAHLLLIPRAGSPARPLLDGPGFRVLSLISTKITDDCGRMFDRGGAIASTGIMELKLDRKKMLLDLVQGPDGVMVEIFQTLT